MDTNVTEGVLNDLRAEIARKRFTQKDVADAVGEHPVWVSRRLRGVTALSIDDFVRLAQAVGLSPVVQVDGTPDHVKALQAERFQVSTRG